MAATIRVNGQRSSRSRLGRTAWTMGRTINVPACQTLTHATRMRHDNRTRRTAGLIESQRGAGAIAWLVNSYAVRGMGAACRPPCRPQSGVHHLRRNVGTHETPLCVRRSTPLYMTNVGMASLDSVSWLSPGTLDSTARSPGPASRCQQRSRAQLDADARRRSHRSGDGRAPQGAQVAVRCCSRLPCPRRPSRSPGAFLSRAAPNPRHPPCRPFQPTPKHTGDGIRMPAGPGGHILAAAVRPTHGHRD